MSMNLGNKAIKKAAVQNAPAAKQASNLMVRYDAVNNAFIGAPANRQQRQELVKGFSEVDYQIIDLSFPSNPVGSQHIVIIQPRTHEIYQSDGSIALINKKGVPGWEPFKGVYTEQHLKAYHRSKQEGEQLTSEEAELVAEFLDKQMLWDGEHGK